MAEGTHDRNLFSHGWLGQGHDLFSHGLLNRVLVDGTRDRDWFKPGLFGQVTVGETQDWDWFGLDELIFRIDVSHGRYLAQNRGQIPFGEHPSDGVGMFLLLTAEPDGFVRRLGPTETESQSFLQ